MGVAGDGIGDDGIVGETVFNGLFDADCGVVVGAFAVLVGCAVSAGIGD